MSARKLVASMKRRAAAKPATAAAPSEDLVRAQRAQQLAIKDAEKARAEAVTATKAAADARADAQKVRVTSAVTSAASKARALNPDHVAQLLAGRVEDRDGKLVVKGTDGADVDVDAFVGSWLTTEGKHFLPASVPGGGSGAPANPNPASPAKAPDLTTNTGLTEYARQRETEGKRGGLGGHAHK